MVIQKTAQELKPVLMESKVKGVKTPYYQIEDKNQTIFVVSVGRNGVEFNKTEGFISNFPGVQTFQCLYGSGILLLQRNDQLGDAKEFKMMVLNPLKSFSVPAGWGMCLINTGNNFLVVLANIILDKKYQVTQPIIEKRGLAYYVIEKKGEIVFEQNPNYQVHPQISME